MNFDQAVWQFITWGLVIVAFLGNGIVTLVAISRWVGAIDVRLSHLEKNEERMSQVLIEMAQSRTEINLLSKRIDDVQRHGSYRLAELLASRNHIDRDDR